MRPALTQTCTVWSKMELGRSSFDVSLSLYENTSNRGDAIGENISIQQL